MYTLFVYRSCSEVITKALGIPIKDTLTNAEYKSTYREGLERIRQGVLIGRAALCILESSHATFAPRRSLNARSTPPDAIPNRTRYLFHGTHLNPDFIGEKLKPRTPMSLDTSHTYQQHGQQGVSFSSTGFYPRIRALFHHNQPAIAEWKDVAPFTMHRIVNKLGTVTTIVPRPVLDLAIDHNAQGWIYTTPCSSSAIPFADRPEYKEYRIASETSYTFAIPVGTDDLPCNIIIVDGLPEKMWEFIATAKTQQSPLTYALRLGLQANWIDNIVPTINNNACLHDSMLECSDPDSIEINTYYTMRVAEMK